jgi:hypothetical protein
MREGKPRRRGVTEMRYARSRSSPWLQQPADRCLYTAPTPAFWTLGTLLPISDTHALSESMWNVPAPLHAWMPSMLGSSFVLAHCHCWLVYRLIDCRGPYYSPMGVRYLTDILETYGQYVDTLKFAGSCAVHCDH